ncbi:MAG: GTPase [Roseiflexaceae bacterium]|nr:GTPase [Roseiflexaceae bacterium]
MSACYREKWYHANRMMNIADRQFTGFSADALASLHVPGVAARWAAVQERLHPQLVALAEYLRTQAAQRLPHEWPLYELSFKDARYVNRGPAGRAPIDEYHLAIDRPPRGAGIYIAISGAERRILVALQLRGLRKPDLRRVWEEGRTVWQPLIHQLNDVRFAERSARGIAERSEDSAIQADDGQQAAMNHQNLWIERYLNSKQASSLLAGFFYSWDDPQIALPAFAERVVADLLALLPLNEAIMEQAEQGELADLGLVREQRTSYATATPPIEEIITRIRARGLTLTADLVRAYHLALQTRPLVILPGISGTGKTRLTRLYADAVHGIAAGRPNERYLLVAVQPDWHNARDLLGYYNAITGKFHVTPFLRFVLRAIGEPDVQFFVCLDEMNLARPEYYLAPILSAIETDERLIDLGAPDSEVEAVSGEHIRNPLRLPRNLAITGTVNVDESTHPLSDKLLDRANVIELTDVDLVGFRTTWPGLVDEAAWNQIVQIHTIAARAGHPFGYRTLNEMLRYLEQARGILTPARALDQQLKQKVLPKLRGEDTPRLRRSLTDLLALTLGRETGTLGKITQIPPETFANATLPESAEKLRRMLERLDSDGFTDFYA